jgi:hypothetical protein
MEGQQPFGAQKVLGGDIMLGGLENATAQFVVVGQSQPAMKVNLLFPVGDNQGGVDAVP